MIETLAGRAWKFGDDINTDLLAPGVYMKGSLEELASHCLESVDPFFAGSVKPTEISKIILENEKVEIKPSLIQLEKEIKSLGVFKVKIDFSPSSTACKATAVGSAIGASLILSPSGKL